MMSYPPKRGKSPQGHRSAPITLDDDRLLQKARAAGNGDLFRRLFDYGDWQGAGYQSQSEADCALCNLLAFWTGRDPDQMDRLFRFSGLMREKWDEKHGADTYGVLTIQDAVQHCDKVYDPRPGVGDAFGRAEYAEGKKEKREKLDTVSAVALQGMELPPIPFIVKGLLPVGLGILVSPPKFGKSFMVLDMGLSVAAGRPFLGHNTEKCGCLYLALEDSKNRLKDRMNKVLGGLHAPEGFDYATKALDLSHGLLEQLEEYLKGRADVRMIIIDTLQKVRGSPVGKEGAYAQDYREMGILKAFADERGVCILLVHHLRKMGDDTDPFNRISGTNGILGAADTAMVLTRDNRGDKMTRLSVTGRDVDSKDTMIEFDKEVWRWKVLGDADWLAEQRARLEYQENPIVVTIKKLLEQNPTGWSGSMKELLDAGKFISKTYLAPTSEKLSRAVKDLEKPLFDYDRIVHSRIKNGKGGGRHHFQYSTVGTVDDWTEEKTLEWDEIMNSSTV